MTKQTFMTTASGQSYNLVTSYTKPRLSDIAHHLAQINRFTGAARRPYSVAEHSILCQRIAASGGASPLLQFAVLMHDAHEAFTNDLSSPAKAAMRAIHAPINFSDWDSFEGAHAFNVRNAFSLCSIFGAELHFITLMDLRALATERRDLMPETGEQWDMLEGVKPHDDRLIDFGNWSYWRHTFFYAAKRLALEAGVQIDDTRAYWE